MLYSQELLEEIQNQNDIVRIIGEYVPLKQKGTVFFGLCPFHNEATPSFCVNPEKQFYYCFGCGAGGNVYRFLMELEGLTFPEAVRKLADRVHMVLPEMEEAEDKDQLAKKKQRLLEIHRLAGRFYYRKLHEPLGQAALRYLDNRGISRAMQKKFGLGYAPDESHILENALKKEGYKKEELLASGLFSENKKAGQWYDKFRGRIMFPIFDFSGHVIAFGGRTVTDRQPKYLNSPETILFSKSKNLYGLHLARAARKKELIVVEGYMDMISIYQAGFPYVAASLGTAFNKEHAKVLRRVAEEVILFFDSDEAGIKAADRAIPVLLESGLRIKVAQVPSGKDPDEFIRQNGTEAFGRLLLEAKSHTAFLLDCMKKNFNMDNKEHKVRFASEAAEILARVPNLIERDAYIKEVSRDSGISEQAVKAEAEKRERQEEALFHKKSEENKIRIYNQKPEVPSQAKGILEAQREILYICTTQPNLIKQIAGVLTPEEFTEPAYQKLSELLFSKKQEAKEAFFLPGELMNYFTQAREQALIAEVFALRAPYETAKDLEKGLNEGIRLLKNASLEKRAASITDALEIQKLIEDKKKMGGICINLSGSD